MRIQERERVMPLPYFPAYTDSAGTGKVNGFPFLTVPADRLFMSGTVIVQTYSSRQTAKFRFFPCFHSERNRSGAGMGYLPQIPFHPLDFFLAYLQDTPRYGIVYPTASGFFKDRLRANLYLFHLLKKTGTAAHMPFPILPFQTVRLFFFLPTAPGSAYLFPASLQESAFPETHQIFRPEQHDATRAQPVSYTHLTLPTIYSV